jgi:hypothetical protein
MPLQPVAGQISVTESNSTVAYSSIQSTLTIKAVKASDMATYECKENDNIFGQGIASINVKIVKAQKLQILELQNGTRLRLKAGNDLYLQCTGEFRSAPRWMHDGMAVKDSVQTTVTDRADTIHNTKLSLLTTNNVTRKAAGRYQCLDSAHIQSDSEVIIVYVSSQTQTAASTASSLLMVICFALFAASNRLFI